MPKDLTEATYCGAIVSLACTIIIALLSYGEIIDYLKVDRRSYLLVDTRHHDDRLNFNVDIVFPRMPCEVITLDIMDVMGTNIVDIAGQLYKKRISKYGVFISQTSMLDLVQNREDLMKKVKQELDEEIGCHLEGFFSINRVPGTFFISTNQHTDLVVGLMQQGYNFDFSHSIYHVSMGRKQYNEQMQKQFGDEIGEVSVGPYAFSSAKDSLGKPLGLDTKFYITAITTQYYEISEILYQLTHQKKSISDSSTSNLLSFDYEISPLSVLFKDEKENIVDFFTHITGMIGGIFTIAGIIDTILHRSVAALFKHRIGKLQ